MKQKEEENMKYTKEEIKEFREVLIDKLIKLWEDNTKVKISEETKDKVARENLEFLDEYWTIDTNGRPVPKCKFKLNEKLEEMKQLRMSNAKN
tara:strand:+ start:85 stop:363 length:279 start_codon:yes stop_codon:yes gene_type:complete